MGTGNIQSGLLIVSMLACVGPAQAQQLVKTSAFDEVFLAERQVNAAHLVVGVIATGPRPNVATRSKAIHLRQPDQSLSGTLCGEVRSLDGLYFGKMEYRPDTNLTEDASTLLEYPSKWDSVFDYKSSDIAVRLTLCEPEGSPPVYRIASWLGSDKDKLTGAQILLNTQSGTDVFAYLGATPLICTPEPEETRQEVDFRCTITAEQIDQHTPVSLVIDRSGSRDPVVRIYVSK